MRTKRSDLLCLLACAAAIPAFADAQTTGPVQTTKVSNPSVAENASTIQEVVVTAERRTSVSQRTAAAVTVRTGQELATEGKFTTRQILEDIPGLVVIDNNSLNSGSADVQGNNITIRGITPPATSASGGPSGISAVPPTAVYVDGDRRFLERFSDVFTTKPWACSLSQIDWASEGYEGTKLGYLAQAAGFFYDRHRAANDCLATVELLRVPLPRSRVTGLSRLLEAARQPSWRIWAEHSPFDLKDALKARGYRWNADPGPQPRAWYIDVPDERREAELHFLKSEIYRREINLLVRRIEAHDRFSERV